MSFSRTAFLLLFAPAVSVGQEPTPSTIPAEDQARARKLVAQLDADEREQREGASTELAKLGRCALPALKEVLAGKPSVEVRRRVNELLPAARAADLREGADAFVADGADRHKHDFEGWTQLKEAAGDSPGSRKLMRLILSDKTNRDILCSSFGEKDDALLAFYQRWLKLEAAYRVDAGRFPRPDPVVPFAPVAGLLLAESLCPGEHPKLTRMRSIMINATFKNKELDKAMTGEGEFGNSLRKLAHHWVESRNSVYGIREVRDLRQTFRLGPEYPARVEVRVLQLPDCDPTALASSMSQLTNKHGELKHLPLFAKHLTDKRLALPANGKFPDIQVRDAALLYSVFLTDQSPADYGFSVLQSGTGVARLYYSSGFVDDKTATAEEKRERGLKKWAEWSAKNLRPEPKK